MEECVWKNDIRKKLNQAVDRRVINKELVKLVKLLLDSNSEFEMVFRSSREQYVGVFFIDGIKKDTAKKLILNGYKQFYLKNNGLRRIQS